MKCDSMPHACAQLDTNTFLYVRDAIDHGSLWRRANTFLVGALMSSFFNFLLIFALGHDGPLHIGGAYGNRSVAKTDPVNNTTLPAGAPPATHIHHNPTAAPPAAAHEPVTEPPVANCSVKQRWVFLLCAKHAWMLGLLHSLLHACLLVKV